MTKGDEDLVVAAFCAWLEGQGWRIDRIGTRYRDEADIYASRPDGATLIVEAKGEGEYIGTDLDIGFGQLLRRMATPDASVRYAMVVRGDDRSVRDVQRVPEWVRDRLRIEVYAVAPDGSVRSVP